MGDQWAIRGKGFLKVGIRWSTMRNCEDGRKISDEDVRKEVQHKLISGREKKGKQVLVWNRESSRSERVGMGWEIDETEVRRAREPTPTQDQHNGGKPGVRAPASDEFNSLTST